MDAGRVAGHTPGMRNHPKAGFTLIELMIVIVVIGLLSAIAIPKFGEAMRTSTEGQTRANLGMVRKALSIYFSDLDGQYPESLSDLTNNARYLKSLPRTKLPGYHADSNAITLGGVPDDGAGWVYDDTVGSATRGVVRINCTHTDARGSVWTSY